MSIDIAILRAMATAGATVEVIIAAIEAAQATEATKLAARRAKHAEYMRRARAVRDVTLTDVHKRSHRVTNAHIASQTLTNAHTETPSPPLNGSPTPLPIITPPSPSDPNGSDTAPAVSVQIEKIDVVDEDPKARLFRLGKTILVSFGVAEKQTGGLIGQWLKAKPDPIGLLAAIQFARDQNVAEPVAYISAIIHGRKHAAKSRDRPTIDEAIALAEKSERVFDFGG